MEMTDDSKPMTKRKRGQQMTVSESNVFVSKLVDYMTEGLSTTYSLAKKLDASPATIEKYKPLADEMIGKFKIDRNSIRVLQIRRTYKVIEMIMKDLESAESYKDRSMMYNALAKQNQHLALITGLNVETQVNVDHKQLVIIRSPQPNKPDREVIDIEEENPITISDSSELPTVTLK